MRPSITLSARSLRLASATAIFCTPIHPGKLVADVVPEGEEGGGVEVEVDRAPLLADRDGDDGAGGGAEREAHDRLVDRADLLHVEGAVGDPLAVEDAINAALRANVAYQSDSDAIAVARVNGVTTVAVMPAGGTKAEAGTGDLVSMAVASTVLRIPRTDISERSTRSVPRSR